jgi:hypothetical protein
MAKKPFSSKEFKALEKEWRQKLKEAGFEDIESPKGHLKQHNIRTISFENRDSLQDFFTSLGHYLATHTIPMRDRHILELYAQGVYVKGDNGIAEMSGLGRTTIYNIIKSYKNIIIKKN